MNLRRVIAFVLLACYLFAVGGEAAAALSCDCVHHGASAERGSARLAAPCCGDEHSTEIALYTALSSILDKAARRVVLALPPTLAAELPAAAEQLLHRCDAAECAGALPDDGLLRAVGLRAPPVLG